MIPVFYIDHENRQAEHVIRILHIIYLYYNKNKNAWQNKLSQGENIESIESNVILLRWIRHKLLFL